MIFAKKEAVFFIWSLLVSLYEIWFSHPAVEAITYWNLVDGYAAYAPIGDFSRGENAFRAGLIRFDFTPKKAFYELRKLFTERWRTNLSLDSGPDGKVKFKGFYGDYEIAVTTAEGKTSFVYPLRAGSPLETEKIVRFADER